MSLGLSNLTNNYYPKYMNQQSKPAESNSSIDFNGILSAKSTENTAKAEWSFKDMWQARFPGAYYHTMDASNIPMGMWCRNDYPFEKFFQNGLDESILDWKSNGPDPAMDSSGVQSRLQSIRGQKVIVVPPALEEKMKNDSALAQRIMAKIENYIVTDEATTPGRVSSYLIVLDENGEIARCRASSGGGELIGPTDAELRQFEAEQAAKRKRRAEYMQIIEESALKQVKTEQEHRTDSLESAWQSEQFNQQEMYDKVIEYYEKGTLL